MKIICGKYNFILELSSIKFFLFEKCGSHFVILANKEIKQQRRTSDEISIRKVE